MLEINKIYLSDCMDIMPLIPELGRDVLAIVDPEYGITLKGPCGSLQKCGGIQAVNYNPPTQKYFIELLQISTEQIIWGANFFDLPGHRCVIVWDKGETMYGRSFSECEIAEASFNDVSRIIKIRPNQKNKIHPTQKPIALYRWLLQNYAKPGQLILDTHSGSGSCACACYLEGYDFIAIEKDADYHRDSVHRLEEIKKGYKLPKEEDIERIKKSLF